MRLCKKLFGTTLLALIILMLAGGGVLAAYSYYATIQVQETDGNSYDYLPIIADIDNDYLADNGYMSLTGLDTRVLSGSTELEHMVADDKTLFVPPSVEGDSTGNYKYTLDNSLLSDFPIIVGDGGHIEIADDDTLDGGAGGMDDFELEFDGYVDTSSECGSYLVEKRDAIGVYNSDDTDITAYIETIDPPIDVSPAPGAWNDVDVSAYVPSGTTGVIVHLTTDNPQRDVNVRKNGSVDNRTHDLDQHNWTMVGVDSNYIFEAYLQDAGCHVYLVGYTGSSFSYFTDAVDISLTAFAAWTDIDLSAHIPSEAVGVVVEVEVLGGAGNFGLRKNGSGDNRTDFLTAPGVAWATIGCDTSQIIDGYAVDTDVNFYLVGYVTGCATFKTNATDKSLVPVGAWTDIDCSAVAPNAHFLIFEVVAPFWQWGLRKNGSAENIYLTGDTHHWAIVECDSNQVVEGKIQNVAADFFLVGYITGSANPIAETMITADDITSGEYTVKVAGEANAPVWATGNVLHFDGTAASNVNAGAIHNAAAKLWVSLWFKLDNNYAAGSGNMRLWGKHLNPTEYWDISLLNASGKLQSYLKTGGFDHFAITSTETSWNAGQWYHILASISDTVGIGRLTVDNGTPVLTADVNAAPNGGSIIIGDNTDPGGGAGTVGIISNVVIGTDDLTDGEETDLFNGIAPADAVNYWYMDEGTGATIYDYGTGGNDGTADANTTWTTSTFTTGKTGRWCDFYIQVDDGVADPDRWGTNLKGISVPNNANDWVINQGVFPFLDYYKHTVGGTLIAWYQPISMIMGTNLDDREGTDAGETGTAEEDATITWGANPAGIDVAVGSLISSGQPPISPASEEVAQDIVPEGEIPAGGVVNTGKLQDNPVYPIVKVAHDYTGFSEEQIWFAGATLIILLGMGLSAVKVPNHLLLAGTVGLVLGGFFTAMEIYQWWMMLIFGFIFVMSILMERKPVL